MSALSACGNFTLLAANISLAVRMVFQLQLVHDHKAAPLTLRYISQTVDQYRKKFVPKSILENHRARSAKQGSMGVAM